MIKPGKYAFLHEINLPSARRSEFTHWCAEHGIPIERMSLNQTIIVIGGGRVSVDFMLPGRAERGRLTVPLRPGVELPHIFCSVDAKPREGITT